MKNLLILTVLILAGMVSAVSAQSPQTVNEGYVGVSVTRQDVEFNRTPVLKFREESDSVGVVGSYTRYVNNTATNVGTVGLTAELAANFANGEARVATLLGGFTVKGRNYERFQPSVKVLAGVGRQHVSRGNVFDNTDVSSAFSVGAGLDVALTKGSRYKVHTGLDYVNTGFGGERQNGARATIGLTF